MVKFLVAECRYSTSDGRNVCGTVEIQAVTCGGRLSTTNGLQSRYTVYPTETEIAADRMSPSAAIVIKLVRLRDVQSISTSS